jgi:uncharacterized membrane protein
MENRQNPATADNGKTTAIVAYITIIGWLIAYFAMYKDNKTKLGGYHLRQTLLLHIVAIGLGIIRSIFFSMFFFSFGSMWLMISWAFTLVNIALFVLWLLGLISAFNEQEKPIPVLGGMSLKMFANL